MHEKEQECTHTCAALATRTHAPWKSGGLIGLFPPSSSPLPEIFGPSNAPSRNPRARFKV